MPSHKRWCDYLHSKGIKSMLHTRGDNRKLIPDFIAAGPVGRNRCADHNRQTTKAILHSDGDLRLVLDQLVSAGLDGYQSIDPQGHMDIAEVKKLYGDRLILMGNVQASKLQEVDDYEIRNSVRYCMTHGKPRGRYIFSTSNCIFAGMPLESYHIMLNEYEKMAEYC